MISTHKVSPVITPEAQALIDQLKLEQPLHKMLDHIAQAVPALRALQVDYAPAYEAGYDPGVILNVTVKSEAPLEDTTERDFGRWQIDNFPPEVFQHFTLLAVYE